MGGYYHQFEDTDQWEIYVKYRKFVSEFLTNRTWSRRSNLSTYQPPARLNNWSPLRYYRPATFIVVQEHYVSLAYYLLSFLPEGLR